MTLTSERLAELERASANCVRRGHPEWVLDVRADELAALCRATRLAALLARRCRALESKLNSTVGQARQGHPDGELIMEVRAQRTGVLTPDSGNQDAAITDADIDRSIIRRQARDLLDRARAISHSWEQFARPSNSSNSGSEWLHYRESARLLNEAIALLERIAGETGK